MNRPKGIYFVIIWFFIAFGLQVGPLSKVIATYNMNHQDIPSLWRLLTIGMIAVWISTMIGLYRLSRISRWIAIVLFVLSAIMPIVNIIFNLARISSLARFSLFYLFIVSPSVVSIWYLLSPKFNKQCDEYRAEKDRNRFMLPVK